MKVRIERLLLVSESKGVHLGIYKGNDYWSTNHCGMSAAATFDDEDEYAEYIFKHMEIMPSDLKTLRVQTDLGRLISMKHCQLYGIEPWKQMPENLESPESPENHKSEAGTQSS